jgi:formate dehydrogenase maturation protein FdhE
VNDPEQRAQQLALEHPGSAELLRFAAGLLKAQGSVRAAELPAVPTAARPVLDYCARSGPPELAADAREMLGEAGAFETRVRTYWETGEFDYLARAALQPYARMLRETGQSPGRGVSGTCVFCGSGAWIASRRIPPGPGTGEGSLRMLHCALCAFGWQVGRIRCPSCGEEDPEKLPLFTAPQHIGVRVEACETCKTYVKSIDLSLDARRIPEIDDLVSLSMDLWATEQGYRRMEPGIAGL